MTPISVFIGVPSREGAIREDVRSAILAARDVAGVETSFTVSICPYSATANRNKLVAEFLAGGLTHLLLIDDDVIVPPNTITDLLACNSPIASGCIPSLQTLVAGDQFAYVQVQNNRGLWARTWFEGTVEAEAVGGGCMLVRRDVFTLLPFPWFRWPERLVEGGVRSVTEDVDFCWRAKDAGLSILAAGSVRCGHRKVIDVATLIPATLIPAP